MYSGMFKCNLICSLTFGEVGHGILLVGGASLFRDLDWETVPGLQQVVLGGVGMMVNGCDMVPVH